MPRKKLSKKDQSTTDERSNAKIDKCDRDTVIMFVDIMGSSEVSNHKRLRDYSEFVRSFQTLFREICKKYTDDWYEEEDRKYIRYSARGDEGLLMIYRQPDQVGVSKDVDIAINIALDLKRQWVCSDENKERIMQNGLLPINLAIGIHAGKTYLAKSGISDADANNWAPEGYAINLAKRVEGYSREGRFTYIFLSEAAHGYLNLLPDEKIYLFDNPQVFTPKGIMHDIRVYEIKHHYLPTDWKEMATSVSKRSATYLNPESADIGVLEKALRINPTNLWLTEEFILSSMLQEYCGLPKDERDNEDVLRNAFSRALEEATRLTQGDQRDAGALFLQGLIEGECGQYEEERDRYQDAIQHTDQLAEAYWYKGLSYSYQVWDEIDHNLEIPIDELKPQHREWIDEALSCLKKAKTRRPHSAWIPFDYGCECIRWAQTDEELTEGIEHIELAVNRLDDVRYEIADQDYLKKVMSDPRIKKLLPK